MSDGEDDKTPPRGRPTRYAMTEAERDTRRAPTAAPMQLGHADDEVTSPFDLFKPERRERRKRGDSVVALAAKLRDERPDPYDLIASMAFEFTDAKRATKSESKELDRQLKAFLAIQPGGERFTEVEKAIAELAPVRRGLRWLQVSFFAVAVAIGTWLYARGGKETAIDMRIQALEKTVDKIVDRLEERRKEPHEDHP